MNRLAETATGMYREYALAQKMYQAILSSAGVEVSDDEARTVTVQSILIKTYDVDPYGNHVPYDEERRADARRRAAAILQEIRDGMANYTGVSFDTWISRYNEAGTGTDTFGKGERDRTFEEAAFSQEQGKIGDIVETADGYRIIKVLHGSDDEEIRINKEKIAAKRREEAFETLYNAYLKNVSFVLDEDAWNRCISGVDDVTIISSEDSFFDVYEWIFHG